MKLTEREPVALSGLVSGLAAAVIAVLVAFNVWSPTDEQTAAVYGLLAALIAVTTTLARGKAWAPASVTRALEETKRSTLEAAALDRRVAVAEAMRETLPAPAAMSGDARRQLDDLLERLTRLPAWSGLPTEQVPPPPVREPLGVLINPNLVGGRDPTSDGNR